VKIWRFEKLLEKLI